MKIMRYIPLMIIVVLMVTLSACVVTPTRSDSTPVPATATPQSQATSMVVEPKAVSPTVTAMEIEAATATAMPEPTATPTPKPLTGPRATAEALAKAVTIVPAATPAQIAADDYPAIFEHAWQIVNENYVRDNFNGIDWQAVLEEYRPKVQAVQDQEAFWEIMDEFIRELDDNHSRFVRPDQFAAEFDLVLPGDESSRPWTGMQIWPAREDEQLMLWYVCQHGPAADAGLQRGDLILAVNGRPVSKTESGFDSRLIRLAVLGDGESDTVTLTVQRGPEREPEDIELKLGGAAGCDGWQYDLLSTSPRIGYLRVPDFSGDTDVNILEAIERLEDNGPLAGLVVDVRHNPGGNADRSIAIFTEGIFGRVGPLRADATQTIYRIRGPVRWNETTPVAVLTDGASHSAAEYFATAMQQSGRAVIVGMPTAGNTEGISGFSLPDGSLIRLAVMTLELPDGTTLEGTGVIPDIQVPLGDWGLRQVPDIQLLAAYQALAGD